MLDHKKEIDFDFNTMKIQPVKSLNQQFSDCFRILLMSLSLLLTITIVTSVYYSKKPIATTNDIDYHVALPVKKQLDNTFLTHYNKAHKNNPITSNDIKMFVLLNKDSKKYNCQINTGTMFAQASDTNLLNACEEAAYTLNGMLFSQELRE